MGAGTIASPDGHTGTPILRHAGLGDVHVTHDLYPARHRGTDASGQRSSIDQGSIDPEAHEQVFGSRLKMDIAGTAPDALEQQSIDQPHDRRLA